MTDVNIQILSEPMGWIRTHDGIVKPGVMVLYSIKPTTTDSHEPVEMYSRPQVEYMLAIAASQAVPASSEWLKTYSKIKSAIDEYGATFKQPPATHPAESAQTTDDEKPNCIWTEQDGDDMPGTYASACGELWSFIDGGVKENNVRFCQGCGKPVAAIAASKGTA